MNTRFWIAGMGTGASLMYLLDPETGKRRRAHLRDRVRHAWRVSGRAWGKTARDIRNRGQGMAAAWDRLWAERQVPADVLESRVRSQLGRLTSHARAIQVEIRGDGEVRLSGPVLANEAAAVISGVAGIVGVKHVENRLEPREQHDSHPALQGGRPRGHRFELLQSNWSPAARALVGAAGSTMAIYGIARRGTSGTAMGFLGAAALAYSMSGNEVRDLLGRRGSVSFRKTVEVDAPPGDVFAFWSDFGNFPRFLSHLREVKDLGGGRSHWVAAGPAGVPVEWHAHIVDFRPGRLIAWITERDSVVRSSGEVRFEQAGTGRTRLEIRMTYRPPAGAAGHVVARLFGADPGKAMEEDIGRLKNVLERGERVPG